MRFYYNFLINFFVNSLIFKKTQISVKWGGVFCNALSDDLDSPLTTVVINYKCSFGGDLGSTVGSISTQSIEFGDETTLTCDVPLIPTLDSLSTPTPIKLDIEWSVSESYGTIIEEEIGLAGSREVYGKTYQTTIDEEVLSHSLMVLYHPSTSSTPSSCGCSPFTKEATSPASSPFTSGQSSVCDECLVCGGDESTVDCNGDCHGAAKFDQCGVCAGGLSSNIPESTCDTGFYQEVFFSFYL